MSVDRRRVALLALLVVSVALVVYQSPLTRGLFDTRRPVPARPPAAPPPTAAAVVPPVEVPPLPAAELQAWRARHAGAWRRDPFFTAQEEAALRAPRVVGGMPESTPPPVVALPAYTLKMVLIAGASKVASIDGRLVGEGEMLGEERIVEILPTAVVLELGGRRRRLEVPGGLIPLREAGARGAER